MAHDFDTLLYRCATELTALADLHLAVGTRESAATGRAVYAGAAALMEVIARDLPTERLVTRGTLGLSALAYYGQAGMGAQSQRLAARLLSSELEPGKREAIVRWRGSRSLEAFPIIRGTAAWAGAA